MGDPFAGTWAVAFNTDDAVFGGNGFGDKAPLKTEKIPFHDQQQSFVVDLPPMSTVIYRCTRKNPVRKPKDDSGKAKKAPAKKAAAEKKAPANKDETTALVKETAGRSLVKAEAPKTPAVRKKPQVPAKKAETK